MTAPVIDKLVDFDTAPGGDLVIKHTQFLPDGFMSALQHEREDSLHTPAGDFHRVASISVAAVEMLMKRGVDIYKAPIREILKQLRKLELDGFITTNKRV